MLHYCYKCFDCDSEFSAQKIESELIYLCPICGESKKNTPLKGVLLVKYDLEFVKSNLTRSELLQKNVGRFWKYPYLWPLKITDGKYSIITEADYSKLSLSNDPLLSFDFGKSRIDFWDETRNPTYSFKDRASTLVALKAFELGINEIAAASTGNAGSSLAGICARLGLKSKLFVPKNIPKEKLNQIMIYGADTVLVDGDYDVAYDICLELSEKNNWYNRNTAYNPLTIEGKKSAAIDLFIKYQGNLPDYIIVPVGDGVIISGLYKGFSDLLELGWICSIPKLIAVQANGSKAVVEYFNTGKFEYQSAETIADSICAGAPRNLYMAAESIKTSGGFAVSVSDDEILISQKELAINFGILAEPAAAAAFSGYKEIRDNINKDSRVLIMISGCGLKDSSSLSKLNCDINPMKYEEILRKFE